MSVGIQSQRMQVAEAVLKGHLDSVLASDLNTAKANGFAAGKINANIPVNSVPVDGINR